MNTDYTFRRLSSDEVLDIYENSCPLHFPAPEIKPVFMIKSMVERGGYIGIGVYDGDRLAGYALCVQAPEKNTILLDYLAVFEEYRNKGVGALMLKEMQRIYTDMHGVIIETERPDKAEDEEDRTLRIRRNGFYKRSGCRQTELLTQVAGVDFGIFTCRRADRCRTKKWRWIYRISMILCWEKSTEGCLPLLDESPHFHYNKCSMQPYGVVALYRRKVCK